MSRRGVIRRSPKTFSVIQTFFWTGWKLRLTKTTSIINWLIRGSEMPQTESNRNLCGNTTVIPCDQSIISRVQAQHNRRCPKATVFFTFWVYVKCLKCDILITILSQEKWQVLNEMTILLSPVSETAKRNESALFLKRICIKCFGPATFCFWWIFTFILILTTKKTYLAMINWQRPLPWLFKAAYSLKTLDYNSTS